MSGCHIVSKIRFYGCCHPYFSNYAIFFYILLCLLSNNIFNNPNLSPLVFLFGKGDGVVCLFSCHGELGNKTTSSPLNFNFFKSQQTLF